MSYVIIRKQDGTLTDAVLPSSTKLDGVVLAEQDVVPVRTLAQAVALAKQEIREEILADEGIRTSRGVERVGVDFPVPTTFGELHDVCDANTLGGLCDDDLVLDSGEHADMSETVWALYGEALQDAVHAWLKECDGDLDRLRDADA